YDCGAPSMLFVSLGRMKVDTDDAAANYCSCDRHELPNLFPQRFSEHFFMTLQPRFALCAEFLEHSTALIQIVLVNRDGLPHNELLFFRNKHLNLNSFRKFNPFRYVLWNPNS